MFIFISFGSDLRSVRIIYIKISQEVFIAFRYILMQKVYVQFIFLSGSLKLFSLDAFKSLAFRR